ncbi:MAG: zinc carboxypeptidase [Elusimicrobia bacterium]|nr:zinc carboxypeptidase [Elusimicrobiota bacterium]
MKKIILSVILFGFCAYNLGAAEIKTAAPGENAALGQLLEQPAANPQALANPPAPAAETAAAEELKNDDRYWITVLVSDRQARTKLLELGMDIVEVKPEKVSGFVHKDTLPVLQEKGYKLESRQTIYEYAKQYLKDFPPADSAYHNYKETTELLNALAAANPGLASLSSIGKTIEGRDIWCLRLNSSQKEETAGAKPAALYVANHHAREHLSNEVALGLASWLLGHKDDAEIKKYLETLDIYIIPMLNADGAEYDIRTGKYRWHRKNMRVNADKTIGVDLNRNYDARWCTAGASHSPYSDTYCGTAPFSEPEALALKKFIEARKNIKTLMSYHSYSDLILYPWAGLGTPLENEKDRKVFEKMAKAMAGFTGYTPQQSSDLYVATGDTTDWAYMTAGIFAFTTELEGRGFYPGAGIIEHAVTNNVKAAVYMLSVTDDPYKLTR